MSGFIKSLGNFPVVATDSQRIGEVVLLNTNVAPLGFIPAQGSTIGKLGSGATYAADDYNELYIKLWTLAGLSVSDSTQPYYLSGGAKGASAAADWTAGKTIKIDESGLFARASGGNAGTVGAKQLDEFKSHTHIQDPHTHSSGFVAQAGTTIPDSGGNYYRGTTGSTTATNQNTGGVETRPVNVAKYAFIRYAKSTTVLSEGPEGAQGPIGPQGIQGIPGPVDSTNAILTTPTINGGIINDPAILEVKQDTKANLVTYATTASDGQLAYATDTKEFLTISQTKTAPFGKKEALKYSIVMG